MAQTGDDALRFAQRSPGLTAKSLALGGTGVAGIGDASAFFTNPAGLAWSEGSSFGGAVVSALSTDLGVFNTQGPTSAIEKSLSSTNLGNLSYLFKVPTTRGSMIVGASVSEVARFDRSLFFDGDNSQNSVTDFFIPFSTEFVLEDDGDGGVFPSFDRTISFIAFETFAIDLDAGLVAAGDLVPFNAAVSAGTVAQYGLVEEKGRLLEFNFGGAAEIVENVMVGVSLNVPVGTYEYQRILEEEDYRDDNDGTNGTTDFSYLYFSENFKSEMVGVNARFGVSAQVNDNLRLGASVETPTYYAIDDDFHTVLQTEFDNGDFFSYGLEDDQQAGSGVFSYNITTPWKISAGGAFNMANFTFFGDVEVINWSQTNLSSDGFSFEYENDLIERNLESVVNVRLGAAYDFNAWQFRLGAGVYPDAHGTQFALNGFPDTDRERTFASAGFGYSMTDDIKIDVAWMAEQYDDRYDLYNEVIDAPYVLEEVTRNRFQVGFTVGF